METGNKKQVFGIRGRKFTAYWLALLTLLGTTLFAATANAIPITYNYTVFGVTGGYRATGATDYTSFANTVITLTFTGDTDTVRSYDVAGATGFINDVGVATVSIGGTTFSDTFTDWMYVSTDATNGGIGFGRYVDNVQGAYDPVYPMGMITNQGSVYDLASDFSHTNGFNIPCSGLDTGSCANVDPTIIPLATTQGDFYLSTLGFTGTSMLYGTFSSTTTPVAGVSEPGTLALLPLGLVVLGFANRKHKQKSAA